VLRTANPPSRQTCRRWVLFLGLTGLTMLGFVVGCASSSSESPAPSPVVIVVRNRCGLDLRTVSLRGPALADGQANWLGTISPVPRGTAQILGRRSAAFLWPSVVEVLWTDVREREYGRKIALERLLKQVAGKGGKTLIVEIRPEGDLAVYPADR